VIEGKTLPAKTIMDRSKQKLGMNRISNNFKKQLQLQSNRFFSLESSSHFCAGLVAGVVECLVGHPLETIRVMGMKKPYESMWKLFLNSLSQEGGLIPGLIALYRGSVSELIGSALTSAYVYGTNDLLKRIIGQSIDDNNYEKVDTKLLISAAVTGCLDVISTKPLEMIKLRQQASIEIGLIHESFFKRAHAVIGEGGLLGLYRGWIPTILREAVGSMAFFAAFQYTKNFMIDSLNKFHSSRQNKMNHQYCSSLQLLDYEKKEDGIGFWESHGTVFIAGAMAGLFYTLLSHPFDVISIAMQIDLPIFIPTTTPAVSLSVMNGLFGQANSKKDYLYKGTLDCVRKVVNKDGYHGLFQGLGSATLRSIPCFASSLWSYEVVLAYCDRIRARMSQ
jgi:hypothetical protein